MISSHIFAKIYIVHEKSYSIHEQMDSIENRDYIEIIRVIDREFLR